MPHSRIIDAVRRILLVVVVTAVAVVVWTNWDQVAPHLRAISPTAWALAMAAALLSPFLTLLGWRRVLADLGSPLSPGHAARVFLVGQLGKYVPGSVWSLVVQTEMAARFGVPRHRTGVAALVAMAMSLLTGALVGIPVVPAVVDLGEGVSLVLAGLACAVLAIGLYPPVLNRAIAWMLRLLRRPPLEHDLSGRAIITMAALFTLAWLSAGASVWALAQDLVGHVESPVTLAVVCISGFALASSIGMLSVVLPAGVGVREAILVVLLAGSLTLPAATAVVILTRFLSVAADILWALIGSLWGRR